MNEEAQRFLQDLEKALDGELHANEIVAEYRMHLEEMLREMDADQQVNYAMIVERLGTPEELAALWKEEKSVTPKKMQHLFVFLNVALFLGGALFTIGYHLLEWEWLDILWKELTESATFLIFLYLFFWGLLGYEIGKAFGARGKRILNRTFLICIIPNLILIYLILFRLIPDTWFEPVLNYIWIISTIVLYPISLLGYYWGRKQSV